MHVSEEHSSLSDSFVSHIKNAMLWILQETTHTEGAELSAQLGKATVLFIFCPAMEYHAKNVNIYWNTNIYFYLETSGGHNSNLYLNVVHFLNTGVN
jgi:hypothetical protein